MKCAYPFPLVWLSTLILARETIIRNKTLNFLGANIALLAFLFSIVLIEFLSRSV